MARYSAVVLAVLATTSCESSLGVQLHELPLVTTSDAEYVAPAGVATQSLELPFLISNRTNRVLYLRLGCAVELEQRVADTWAHTWGGRECLDALEDPTAIVPGVGHYAAVTVRHPSGWPLSARYRLVLTALSDDWNEVRLELGANLPAALRVSNEFVVELEVPSGR